LSRESGEDYANITLFERDVGGVFGRVVAHIPQLAGILNYDSMLRYGGGNLVVQMNLNPGPSNKKAVKFHWSQLLSLCASLEGVVSSLAADRLLNDLQVRRRQSGPISDPVLEFSGALRATAIENACAYHMAPLSAFDAKAWRWIRSGWELKEQVDRQQEVDIRQQELAKLDRLWAGDHDRHRIELEKRMNEWAREADSRPRSWVGWWAE
jgi:DNA polymerase III subunit gamma/tau